MSAAKLDRFLLWEMKYTNAVVIALPRYGSDHVPLLLECETGKTVKRVFKFERSWFQQEYFIQSEDGVLVACTVVKRRIGEAF